LLVAMHIYCCLWVCSYFVPFLLAVRHLRLREAAYHRFHFSEAGGANPEVTYLKTNGPTAAAAARPPRKASHPTTTYSAQTNHGSKSSQKHDRLLDSNSMPHNEQDSCSDRCVEPAGTLRFRAEKSKVEMCRSESRWATRSVSVSSVCWRSYLSPGGSYSTLLFYSSAGVRTLVCVYVAFHCQS
jgi:hypothetical protein